MTYKDIVTWWQEKNLKDEDDYRIALENFNVLFASNSNALEGNTINYHTTREIFEGAPVSSSGFTTRELFEAQNQKFTTDIILRSVVDKRPINIKFIKKLHRTLLYGCYDGERWRKGERPGEFKKHDYCVGVSEVGSLPEDVENDLQDLLNEVNESSGDVFTVGAYLHAVFETIHPFADGNGRVGRTLLNYYFMLKGHPPIIIFSDDKDAYYMALEVYNRTEELSGFITFLKEQLVKTWSARIPKSKPSLAQITKLREYAPKSCSDLSDEELWSRLGHMI